MACDSEKGYLFDWPCGCFPTWQPPVRSIATTPSTSLLQEDSSAQHIIWIHWEPDACPYHKCYPGNALGHSNAQNQEDGHTDASNRSITCTKLLSFTFITLYSFLASANSTKHERFIENR